MQPDTRVWLLREIVKTYCQGADVICIEYTVTTPQLMDNHASDIIIRGVRDIKDCEAEMRQATVMENLWGKRTVLIPTIQFAHVSSSLVKELLSFNDMASVEQMVPPLVFDTIRKLSNE